MTKAREIFQMDCNETGETLENPIRLGTLVRANPEYVEKVINADPNSDDGRSDWYWFRLANGDLMLACFPQGDTYFETEGDLNRP